MTDVTNQEAAAPKPRAKKKQADPVARLRSAAWHFLAGHRGRKPRKVASPDPVALFRRASWEELRRKRRPVIAIVKGPEPLGEVARAHLKAVLEALIFAADQPASARELAKSAQADARVVKMLLGELVDEYKHRGFRLDEIAGGFVFRTSPAYAPFVREQVAKKPVRMTRAQVETLAIVAYRQPVTRPEVDDVRGVDSGATLKTLLERDLVRILGKKDEPGRPMIYGTTNGFLNFFGLKALADLPTLREFTELSDESKRTFERELGEEAPETFAGAAVDGLMGGEGNLRRPGVEIVPDSFAFDSSLEAAENPEEVEESLSEATGNPPEASRNLQEASRNFGEATGNPSEASESPDEVDEEDDDVDEDEDDDDEDWDDDDDEDEDDEEEEGDDEA